MPDSISKTIATLFQIDSEIPVGGPFIDEANIEVAIGRSESPCSAAGFDREQNVNTFFALSAGKSAHDFFANVDWNDVLVVGHMCHD
jgi:hypothetical protein